MDYNFLDTNFLYEFFMFWYYFIVGTMVYLFLIKLLIGIYKFIK